MGAEEANTMKVICLLVVLLAPFISTAAETNSAMGSPPIDAHSFSNFLAELRTTLGRTNEAWPEDAAFSNRLVWLWTMATSTNGPEGPAKGRVLMAFASTNSLQLSNSFERILSRGLKGETERIAFDSLDPVLRQPPGMDSFVFQDTFCDAYMTKDCVTVRYGGSKWLYGYKYGTGCPLPNTNYYITTNITEKLRVFVQRLDVQ